MTRFLSESLQAPEPAFHLGLRRLEAASGHQSSDIRLTSEVLQATQAKLRELGLDPHDTTAAELYHVLMERVRDDDAQLVKVLRTSAAEHISAEGDVVAGMVQELQSVPGTMHVFALKAAKLKTILKKLPPKKAMKQLGYRSLDSFLKHESPVSVLTAAWLSESAAWQHQLLDQYKALKPSDFEMRRLSITRPMGKRWQTLAQSTVDQKRHNLLSFRELGAIVLLPLPNQSPSGIVTASLSLALHELNEIRASSTYLKLCQVRADFGMLVHRVVRGEANLDSMLLDRPVPWHLVQRYYARFSEHFREELFEPHIQLEDMSWQPVEHVLSHLVPSFSFWHNSAHLGLKQGGHIVGLNVVDAALNYGNNLPFESRVQHYFQTSLWHELLLKYLSHDTVEQTVLAQLQPELALA